MKALLPLLLLGLAPQAMAHAPFLECKAMDAERIRCLGGFSDGSQAQGVKLRVLGHDGQTLLEERLGADSSLTFQRPAVPYFVLFDVGPGYRAEVDSRDIAGP